MQIKIDENSADQRLDRFLRKYCKPYPEVKLSDIFSWLRKGIVKVISSESIDENIPKAKKKKENYRLKLGDIVVFSSNFDLGKKNPISLLLDKKDKLENINPEDLAKIIVFEDNNRLVFDKPSGIVMHSNNPNDNNLAMYDYLVLKTGQENFSEKDSQIFKPSFCFRLDKDTSGILIAGKTYESLKYLNQIIRERKVEKYYLTIVPGEFPKHIKIDKPLEKSYNKNFDRSQTIISKKGKESTSEAWNLQTIEHNLLGKITLLKVRIYTGRMHQIRVHLESEGFPVLGDIVYGNNALNRILYKNLKINRQLLHCWRYSYWDDIEKKKQNFETNIPKDFIKLGFNIR